MLRYLIGMLSSLTLVLSAPPPVCPVCPSPTCPSAVQNTLDPTPIGCVSPKYFDTVSSSDEGGESIPLTGRNRCIQTCQQVAAYTYAYALDQTQECYCSTGSAPPAGQIRNGFGKYGDCKEGQAYISYLRPPFSLDECFTNIYGFPIRQSTVPSIPACMTYCDLPTDPLPPPVAVVSPQYNASSKQYEYDCRCFDVFVGGADPTDCGKDVVWRYTRGVEGDYA